MAIGRNLKSFAVPSLCTLALKSYIYISIIKYTTPHHKIPNWPMLEIDPGIFHSNPSARQ